MCAKNEQNKTGVSLDIIVKIVYLMLSFILALSSFLAFKVTLTLPPLEHITTVRDDAISSIQVDINFNNVDERIALRSSTAALVSDNPY